MSNGSHAPLPHAAAPSWYRWELLALLFCSFFFHQCDRAIFSVALPAIQKDLSLDSSAVGMVGSALFLTLALLMPVAGYIGDIFNKKWIITASVIFWSSATALTGLAQGVWGLIAFRSVATAGGESFYAPAAYPLLAAYRKTTRGLAMSVHQASLYIGVISSGFLGGYIALHYGWRSMFWLFGLSGVMLGAVFAFRLRSAPPETHHNAKVGPIEALGVLLRTPTALLLTVGFTAIVLVNNAYVMWAPAFVGEKFGLDLLQAGVSAMLYHHLAALVGVLLGGPLSDALVLRMPRFRLVFQSIAMPCGAPAILLLGQGQTLAATETAMAVFGLCRGLYESNTHASLFDVIPSRYRASAVGVMVMLGFLAGSTSPWLLGKLRDHMDVPVAAQAEVSAAAPASDSTAAVSPAATPRGRGLSLGFSLLSIAYLVGALAVAVAAFTTFYRDRVLEPVPEPSLPAPAAQRG